MKKIIFIILILLICQIVSADTTNYEMYPGDIKQIKNGPSFHVDIDNSWDSLMLYVDEDYYILNKGKCKERDTYKFCFEDTEFNLSENKGKYLNYKTPIPWITINVTELKATLDYSRTFESKTLLVKERNKVNIEIENTGNKPAQNIVLTEIIPPNLDITFNSPKLKKVNNNLIWTGILQPNKKQLLTYSFYPQKKGDFTINSTLTYKYLGKDKKLTITPDKINVKDIYVINSTLNQDTFSLGDNVKYTINIKNQDSENELRVTELKIYVPKTISNHNKGDLNKISDYVYSISKTIKPLNTYSISFNGTLTQIGEESFKYISTSYIGGKRFSSTEENKINTNFIPLNLILNATSIQIKNKSSLITTAIHNQNKNTDFINISCKTYKYNMIIGNQFHEFLKANTSRIIAVMNFTSKPMSENKYHPFKVKCSYVTKYGQEFTTQNNISIQVLASKLNETKKIIKGDFDDGNFGFGGANKTDKVIVGSEKINLNENTSKKNTNETIKVKVKKNVFKRLIDFFQNLFT